MLLLHNHVSDYHVEGTFESAAGQAVCERRVCHNMTKREAKMEMRLHLLQTYADTMNLERPIKIKVTQAIK